MSDHENHPTDESNGPHEVETLEISGTVYGTDYLVEYYRKQGIPQEQWPDFIRPGREPYKPGERLTPTGQILKAVIDSFEE